MPGSLTSPAPAMSPGCHSEMAAPDGSAHTAMRPAVMTSIGSTNTAPPSSLTLATEASTSATLT